VSLVSTSCRYNTAQLIIMLLHLTTTQMLLHLTTTQMRPIITEGITWCVCLSLGWSVAIVRPAKTAGPIEMPFQVWTRVGPKNHVLDGVEITHARGNFDGENVICILHSKRLAEQDQQFFYNGIPALEKRQTKCISVAGNMMKSDKICCRPTYLVINCVSLRTF